jgi:hypothetical protein
MPKVKTAGTKKTKAKKDPNAPKRPLSAYKALKIGTEKSHSI